MEPRAAEKVEGMVSLNVYGGGTGREERRLQRHQRFITQRQKRMRQQSQKRDGDNMVVGLTIGVVLG